MTPSQLVRTKGVMLQIPLSQDAERIFSTLESSVCPQVSLNRINPAGCSKRHPTRPQASHNRRRTLWGTLRIVTNRERRWRAFSASCQSRILTRRALHPNEIFSLRRPSQPHAAQTSRAGASIPHAGHHSRSHDQILPMVLAMAMRPRQHSPVTGRTGLGRGL